MRCKTLSNTIVFVINIEIHNTFYCWLFVNDLHPRVYFFFLDMIGYVSSWAMFVYKLSCDPNFRVCVVFFQKKVTFLKNPLYIYI